MNHDDLDLRPTSDDTPHIPPDAPASRRWPALLAALLVVAVVVTGYFVFRGRQAPPVVDTVEDTGGTTAPPAAPVADADAIPLPPLGETDAIVRELVAQLSSHPTLAAWLATDNLIRTFTVVVSNIATGEAASGHVRALRPRAPLRVETRGGMLYIDPRSYDRYSTLAAAAASIDPAGAARVYRRLKPRIDDAYRELGYPNASFDQTLARAIARLVDTPIPTGAVRVEAVGADAYQFVDLRLETLEPAQKQLIRFGPDHAPVVQRALQDIGRAIGVGPGSPP